MKIKNLITIDGPSYVGKSTIARELSKLLGFTFVNTGHMYRSVAKYAIDLGLDYKEREKIFKIAQSIKFEYKTINGNVRTIVNGEDFTEKLHYPEIVSYSSKIAQISDLRDALTEKQRLLAEKGKTIFEGRDLGTVVFPNAEWKFFITASLDIRALRMKKNLFQRNPDQEISLESLIKKVSKIDDRDINREIAPLIQANDAIMYDNSDSPSEKQDAIILQYYINNTNEIVANNSILLNK